MGYTAEYFKLKSLFSANKFERAEIGEGISSLSYNFTSPYASWAEYESVSTGLSDSEPLFLKDESVDENRQFSYTIFSPDSPTRFDRAILLLHGLNEKNWDKYLVWAWFLAKKTGKPVILFPIAFHMNRTPAQWSNPRIMGSYLLNRKEKTGPTVSSTFVNIALSERLIHNPLRFFTSGKQSSIDIALLANQIIKGEHPLFAKGATLDIFAYSIGVFLSQILLLANPDNLFTNTRLFMFCGGAFFDKMDGVSRFIMDQSAFSRLRHYYIQELDNEMKISRPLSDYLLHNPLGISFKSMISSKNLKKFRERRFSEIQERLRSITLKKDRIIPANGVLEAMERFKSVEVMDFPFNYTHENPFPVNDPDISTLVDMYFEKVFNEAAAFLA
jgi:hypothetical protein